LFFFQRGGGGKSGGKASNLSPTQTRREGGGINPPTRPFPGTGEGGEKKGGKSNPFSGRERGKGADLFRRRGEVLHMKVYHSHANRGERGGRRKGVVYSGSVPGGPLPINLRVRTLAFRKDSLHCTVIYALKRETTFPLLPETARGGGGKKGKPRVPDAYCKEGSCCVPFSKRFQESSVVQSKGEKAWEQEIQTVNSIISEEKGRKKHVSAQPSRGKKKGKEERGGRK